MTAGPAEGRLVPPADGAGEHEGRSSLTRSERAAAFAAGRPPIDRRAALRAGTVPVPRTFVIWIIVGFAVLGLGGIVAEKLFGNGGSAALTTTPLTTLAGAGGSGVPTDTAPVTPAPPSAPPIGASPAAVIGLTHLAGRQAPAVSLQSQNGAPWTLADARGKVVVLTFFNAECDDICPVLAHEIDRADQLLGPRRTDVDFVVVNSDPLETSITPAPPALTETGLAAVPNVALLNGPLTDLGATWKRYGITVAVDNTTRAVTHNDVMDFIDPAGALELRASPFADEDALGVYSLPPAVVDSFAQGVANAAAGLLQRAS